MSTVNNKINQQQQILFNNDMQDPVVRQNFDTLTKYLLRLQQANRNPAANLVFGTPLLSASYKGSALSGGTSAIQLVNGLSAQISTYGNPIEVSIATAPFSIDSTYWSNVEMVSLTQATLGAAVGYYRIDPNGVRTQTSLQSLNFGYSGSLNSKESFSLPAFLYTDNKAPTGLWTYQAYVIITDSHTILSFANVRLQLKEVR